MMQATYEFKTHCDNCGKLFADETDEPGFEGHGMLVSEGVIERWCWECFGENSKRIMAAEKRE
jgi:hypothetical protein